MGTLKPPKIFLALFLICVAMVVASAAQTFTTLASFDLTNGDDPFSVSLVQGTDGNLYGVTQGGGADGSGEVYRITPAGNLTVLHSFCSQTNCSDGARPFGSLVLGTNGNFYGTTSGGGINAPNCDGCGTVFEITPSGSVTTLYKFCSQTNCTDGFNPDAGLVLGVDGSFYGTTYYGGANFSGIAGTVFKITPTGNLTTLYSFCVQLECADGAGSMAALVQATNGNLYGTTGGGGMFQGGTVFEITPTGSLTTLYSFKLVELAGAAPNALVQATDGNFYGTTSVGGTHTACPGGCGSVFRVTIAGKYTNLYNFCSRVDCPDGASPQGTLIQATDGNLYGTTARFGSGGGGGAGGTVFKITPVGLTTIHSFCAQSGCPDGSESSGGLTQATSGTFYGTTAEGAIVRIVVKAVAPYTVYLRGLAPV
jgi:uncharacterized repeat protein (TIGR03803 family)